jgi:hypothetical protein
MRNRNTVMMTVSAFAMIGVGFVAGTFVAPAYSDGVREAQTLAPDIENTDTLKLDADTNDAGHDTPEHEMLMQRRVAQANVTTTSTSTTAPLLTTAQESIDVQARRLPNGTPVAVRGDVVRAVGKTLVLDRPDGRVQVQLPGMIPAVMQGDDVTVFGRLSNRSDSITVRAEAVLQHTDVDAITLQDKATLHMAPSQLQSVNKFNRTMTNGEARRALEQFRYTYTEL